MNSIKKLAKILGIITLWLVILFALYIGWTYVKPILISKSEYAKNLPTIEILQAEKDSLLEVIDTFRIENNILKTKNALQNEIINSNKNAYEMQKNIQLQLQKLESQIKNNNDIDVR